MLSELAGTLGGHRFEGLVADQVCFGAECAAETAGVPLVIACNALPVHFQPDIPVHTQTWPWSAGRVSQYRNRMVQQLLMYAARPVFRPIQQALAARGRTWKPWHHLNEIPPSVAHVAQLPACLDFPRRHAPDHFHHTGPWHEAGAAVEAGFDWAWLDGRPLVYASLGTLQNGLDHLYQLILDACADLPVQVVLTLGRETGPRPQRIPANARVLGYGPQVALLRRASLVITHGGMNTVLEALTQGLPLVALPIANDQPGIAARIRYAGVGDWLPLRGLSPALLRTTVQRIQTDPAFRLRARECAAQLGANDGAQLAAMIIEAAFQKRQRVTRRSHAEKCQVAAGT
jgi:MGT family glycosyltransferase